MPELTLSILRASGVVKPLSTNESGCEWDPDAMAGAHTSSNHHRYRRAVFLVDAGEDGLWRVCGACAQRAPFKRLPKRRLLTGSKSNLPRMRTPSHGRVWRRGRLAGEPPAQESES